MQLYLEALFDSGKTGTRKFTVLKQVWAINCSESNRELILRRMRGTGDMRNHKAAAYHEDGNTTHVNKSLSLFCQQMRKGMNSFIFR